MLEVVATVLSIFGAVLMSSKSQYSKFAYVVWPVASLIWLLFAVEKQMMGFAVCSGIYMVLEASGLYRWIIKDFLLTKRAKEYYNITHPPPSLCPGAKTWDCLGAKPGRVTVVASATVAFLLPFVPNML